MRKTVTILIIILALIPKEVCAQWSFDVPSVEAYINDHKQQRSLLLARATLEQSNILLHEYSETANVSYKDMNVELDKYTRAFDVIDILYQSLRTSLNTYDTYNTVHRRIGDYKTMLTAYYDKCLSHGDVVSTDTLIISINHSMLEMVAVEAENIYHSFSDIVLYVSGAAACSASNLLVIIESINRSLDLIQKHLNTAYFETWKYIQVRIGYWKAQVYRAQTMQELLQGAYGRWHGAGKLDY